MKLLSIFAFVAAAAVFRPCGAAPPEDGARKLALQEFARGNEHFTAKDYEKAATRYQAAYDAFPDPAYLHNVAVCYEKLGRWKDASATLRELLGKMAEDHPAIEEVRKKAAAAQAAYEASIVTVKLTSLPPGVLAEVVSVSGKAGCRTPCEVRTDPGPVTVTFVRGSVRRAQPPRSLDAGNTWEAFEDLTGVAEGDPTGTLQVRVDVPGASVLVDGASVPAGSDMTLSAGEHEVVVTHKDYHSFVQTVRVEQDRTTHVEARLNPASVGRTQRFAGWVTLGVGSAVLVNGIVFAALAMLDYEDARELSENGPFDTERQQRFASKKKSAEKRALVADVSMGVAAAAITAGLVLWLTAPTGNTAPTASGPADTSITGVQF